MGERKIRQVVVHTQEGATPDFLADKVSTFQVEIIERRLLKSNLSKTQKIEVIDQIIENLKVRSQKETTS